MIPSTAILATRLISDLEGSRKLGKSSPENPVRSDVIISKYAKLFEWEINDKSELRDAINYAVVELRKPIGSNGTGYFWCLTSKEIEEYALPYLIGRVQNQYRRIESLKLQRDEMRQIEAKQQSLNFSPIGKLLNETLDLQRVA